MFTALDSDSKKISIEDAVNGEKYLCPVCGNPVVVKAKNSDSIRTHFAHKRNMLCLDNWKHDMSDWHFGWQSRFPIENREVVVENGGIKHRADILINGTVIEFQHSPISGEEFEARNSFYKSCGYRVVWLFDVTDKMKMDDGNLVWKRKNTLFPSMRTPIDALYVQHYLPEREDDILSISKIDSKTIYFHLFSCPIKADNFLKEYGAIEDEDILSIRVILEKGKELYNAYLKMKKEAIERREHAYANAAFNSIMSRQRRRRRF